MGSEQHQPAVAYVNDRVDRLLEHGGVAGKGGGGELRDCNCQVADNRRDDCRL